MLIRAVVYLLLLIGGLLVAVWLQFGPLIGGPLAIFLWPAEKLLWHVDPTADLLSQSIIAVLVWYASFIAVDFSVSQLIARARHGG